MLVELLEHVEDRAYAVSWQPWVIPQYRLMNCDSLSFARKKLPGSAFCQTTTSVQKMGQARRPGMDMITTSTLIAEMRAATAPAENTNIAYRKVCRLW